MYLISLKSGEVLKGKELRAYFNFIGVGYWEPKKHWWQCDEWHWTAVAKLEDMIFAAEEEEEEKTISLYWDKGKN